MKGSLFPIFLWIMGRWLIIGHHHAVGAWLTGRLSAGLTAGVAGLLTCWFLERLVLQPPLRISLHVVFDLLGFVVKDFGHAAGIKATLCFFVIPVAAVWYMDLGVGLFAVWSGIGARPKVW
jgi:hypothetical protein